MIKIILCMLLTSAEAKVKRISETEVDLTKPIEIRMTTQGPTVVDMPCIISHSINGRHKDIIITIGPDNKSTFTLWLQDDSSQPSSLNVRCDSQMFVFDIIPNKHTHQSHIVVNDYYYSEIDLTKKTKQVNKSKDEFGNMKLIYDSSKELNKIDEFEFVKKKLISEETIK